MCGHVGLAGRLEIADEKTFKRLLLFDYLRGPDSTGMAVRKKADGDVKILKMASHPLDFFDSKHFSPLLSSYTSDVFLGHNRAATKGKVNTINAHPFECGHIIGAHNGTLDNSSWIAVEKMTNSDTEVDSLAIFLAIEKHGIEETYKNLWGAWALVWIDTDKGTINFVKNNKRSLYYCMSEDQTKLMWASEFPMMQCAMDLSDAKYPLHADKEGYSFFQFADNTWYSWDIEALADPTKTSKPTVKKLKEVEAPKPPANFTQQGGTVRTTSTAGSTSLTTTYRSEDFRFPLQGDNGDPFAGVIGKDKFNELAKYGCSYCGGEIKYEDEGLVIHYDEDIILGKCCGGGRTETRIYLNANDYDFVSKAF
jgi:predicted glutamine amidotransferase